MSATSRKSPTRPLPTSSPIEDAYAKAAGNFTSFKRLVDRRYLHAPHLQALDEALMEAARYAQTGGARGFGRLIIEMPPRHGKSMTCSRRFPAWFLGRNADQRVMLVSYAANLAEKHGRAARNLMNTAHYQAVFPGVTLARDSRAVDSWDIAGHEGGMDALGITGGATGKGAHLLLIDDPLKSRAEAESDLYRDRIWDAFTDDLYTRLEPGGAVVVVATRWHVDDLTGRLLKNMPGTWKRLKLPALAEDADPLGRPIGAALWPARYPIETLRTIEQTLGPYSFAALYQQRPTPGEGGLFKLNYFEPARQDTPPTVQQVVRYWDLAMSEKTSADYTVGLKLGMDSDQHRYVMDVQRRQIDWGDLTEWMAQVMMADGADVAQGIEAKGYQSRAIQMLNADPRLHGYSIFGYEADKDKFTRALPAAAKAAAGMMHVLDRHWTAAFLDEVCAFPNAAHDDTVDALSGAENMLGDTGVLMAGALSYDTTGTFTGHY
jgi:predicted phage terminase large subunit-like protein